MIWDLIQLAFSVVCLLGGTALITAAVVGD